jgi:hypothetical protein
VPCCPSSRWCFFLFGNPFCKVLRRHAGRLRRLLFPDRADPARRRQPVRASFSTPCVFSSSLSAVALARCSLGTVDLVSDLEVRAMHASWHARPTLRRLVQPAQARRSRTRSPPARRLLAGRSASRSRRAARSARTGRASSTSPGQRLGWRKPSLRTRPLRGSLSTFLETSR